MITDLMKIEEMGITKEKLEEIRLRLSTIKEEGHIVEIEVDRYESRKYKGDFYGLLSILNIVPILWPITLELNELDSPIEFDGKRVKILSIDPEYLETLLY